MIELNFDSLLQDLIYKSEGTPIEAKRATDIGKSIMETVCAFANEPNLGGGYLMLGVDEIPDEPWYKIIGVPDAAKLQSDLAAKCRDMFNVPIRPSISIHRVESLNVVLAFIPEAQPHEKPVYLLKDGVPKGAFRRIGSRDQKFTDEDIAEFYQLRERRTYDETPIPDTSIEDFEPRAIAEYRRLRREVNPDAPELTYNDADLLYSICATTRHKGEVCTTLAGMMLFGNFAALRRYFPMCRVDYIIVEGREWIPDPKDRYEGLEVLEPIILAIPRVTNIILGDILEAFSLPENSIYRKDNPRIPRDVIREAIVNALMHRNYRTSQPIQIIRYSNRIEIHNPGYSLKSFDELGTPGSITRNPKIAAVLHDLNLAENKGTGIGVMIEYMKQANLSLPFFESDREHDNFRLKLLTHHFLNQENVVWLSNLKRFNLSDEEAKALVTAYEVGHIDNFLYRYITGIDTLSASRRLAHLRDIGLLEQQGKGAATFYVLTELADVPVGDPSLLDKDLNSPDKQINPPDKDSNLPDKQINPPDNDPILTLLREIPGHILSRINELGKRSQTEEMYEVILDLCEWRALRPSQIADILERQQKYLHTNYFQKLLRGGYLEYTHPENKSHPQQAYRTVRRLNEVDLQTNLDNDQLELQIS